MMLFTYGKLINTSNILATLTANHGECSQFFEYQIPKLFIYLLLTLLFIIAIYLLYKYKSSKISSKILYTSIIITGTFIVVFSTLNYYSTLKAYKKHIRKANPEQVVIPAKRIIKLSFTTHPPINSLFCTYKAIQFMSNKIEVDNFTFGATQNQKNDDKEIYMLLIGESLTSQRIFFEGERVTMPLMGAIDRKVYFDNFYSTACYTLLSIPQIITRSTPSCRYLYQKEKSVVEPFHSCGFYTAAIIHDGKLLLERNYNQLIENDLGTNIVVKNDIEIPVQIEKLANMHNKLFILSQMQGSHFFYTNYDEPHNKFRPNINSDKNSNSDSLYINAYDNTILYTDSVLYLISTKLDTSNSICAYLFTSDHGEYLCSEYGTHGEMQSSAEYQVPLFFWYSEKYANKCTKKIVNAQNNKNLPLNCNNIFYSVLEMAGISISENYQNHSLSIFADSVTISKRQVILSDHTTIVDVE